MTVTSTEFRRNLNHYYSVVESEDIEITTNGKVIAVLTTPASKRLELARSLYGIIPPVDDDTRDEIRGERLANL
ncbi:MAG: type II toxin-antitoxin system prevent-host-death family antitoxin [Clostridia bacterium]|nr:type II toxin-antitoxin system prevent-host-death family antitoxin [Clostridia bacterium]